jgi:DNA-binding MarR family transcriptional regulator
LEDLKAFGALGERLGLQLHSTDVQAMTILAERLAVLEVTPARATAVVYIALHEGCDQVTLGRALGINRATTMKLVDALEARGAIERRAGRDRRTNALHLTAAGLTLRGEIERLRAPQPGHRRGRHHLGGDDHRPGGGRRRRRPGRLRRLERLGPQRATRLLTKAADALAAKADAFVEAMMGEIGATEGWARFNLMLAAGIVREAAALTTQIAGEVIPSDKPGCLAMAVREPAGVVLGIAPWNAPIILGVRAIATPLACGNTVVLKASETVPPHPRPDHRGLRRGRPAARRGQCRHQRARDAAAKWSAR